MIVHSTRLNFEQLDSRILPTVIVPVTTPVVSPIAVINTNPSHPLHGDGMGNYVGATEVVDAGISDKLKGDVTLNSLGKFKMSGWLQGVGMIAQGRATGELTLTNGKGTITLQLHSQIEPSFSPLPSQFVYSISSATGAYSGINGYGLVTFQFMPAPTAFGQPPQGIVHLWIS